MRAFVKAKRAKDGATSLPNFTEECAADVHSSMALYYAYSKEYEEAVIELMEVRPLLPRSAFRNSLQEFPPNPEKYV
jgi:hypothetical protein